MQLIEWLKSVDEELKKLPKDTLRHLSRLTLEQLESCSQIAESRIDSDTRIRIALTGAFSCGKSSFINALIGQDLAVVDSTPTTRCRTDFVYGPKFQILDKKGGKELSLEKYRSNSVIKHAGEESHYIVELPDPRLDGIVLMDTPGFDPPKSGSVEQAMQDIEISKRAADDADIVFFLFEAKDGTLRADVMEYLRDLNRRTGDDADHSLRIILIMNKADLKPDENALDRIREDVQLLCRTNEIRIAEFLSHVSKPLKKRPEYFQKCQENILHLLKAAQADKEAIIGARHSVWAKINRQELYDLRDSLFKFADYMLESLNKHYKKCNADEDPEYEEIIEMITNELKGLCENYCEKHRWTYSSNYPMEDTGIFDWNWTKDWEAYIVDDLEKFRPSEEEYNNFTNTLLPHFEKMKFAGASSYAKRLADSIYAFIHEVLSEAENGFYKRRGKTRKCSIESEANEVSRSWQRDFLNHVESISGDYFRKRVKDVLDSLFRGKHEKVKIDIVAQQRTLNRLEKLLGKEFPESNVSMTGFKHPLLSESLKTRNFYLVSFSTLINSCPDELRNNLYEHRNKMARLFGSDIDFSQVDGKDIDSPYMMVLNELNDENMILEEQDKQIKQFMRYCLCDIMVVLSQDRNVCQNEASDSGFLSLFMDDKNEGDELPEELKALPPFLYAATTAFDLQTFFEKAGNCLVEPFWAYLWENRGFSAQESKQLASICSVIAPSEIDKCFKENNFTFDSSGDFLLAQPLLRENFEAADFLLQHGADINAKKTSGEGIIADLGLIISVDAFEYLLDHCVEITNEDWDSIGIMDKGELVDAALMRGYKMPHVTLFNIFFRGNSVLDAYLKNGGNPCVVNDDGETLIDHFVLHNRNDLVDILRAKGATPSPDAKSMSQISDEMKNYF